ncbi:MAG: DUF1513 domain-containing protein [Colwellia sp.]|nr:DUF1513 domain-containing protein [Colwellia sp.]
MLLTRRRFLAATAATCAAGVFAFVSSRKTDQYWLVSAATDNNNQHFVSAIDLQGNEVSRIALPARGHDAIDIAGKSGRAIVFARRPGLFAFDVDFISGRIVHQIEPEKGYHFYGHGVISTKNNSLLTSENHYGTGNGYIVERDLSNYQIINRYRSGGIGPHQIALMSDDETLVIANGGIKTHPEQPRKKLNLDSMKPNLSYLNLASGKIIEQHKLDNPQLSIRHLAVSAQDKVIAGLQYQGTKTDLVPLAISHFQGGALKYLTAPNHQWRSMSQYTASVCVDNNNDLVAISCPRADMITYWSLSNDNFLGTERLSDGAGLAYTDRLFASSGKGRIAELVKGNTYSSKLAFSFDKLRWDNHMLAMKIS